MVTDYAPRPAVAPDTVAALGAAADERSAELRAARRLPDDIYRAATEAGLFRQLVAEALGGPATSPLDWFRTGVELARHDASIAWVVTQGAAELGWIAAGGDETWARDVLADPRAASASSVAGFGSMTIDGARSRFGGRWGFNTGCHGATWIGGLALVAGQQDEHGLPVIRWGWVPAERAEIVADWDPSGLHGTGSNTTVIPEQDIPTAWTFSPFDPTDNDRGPHRVLVGNGNWPIATAAAATQLGNARRAVDEVSALAVAKAPPPDFVPLAKNGAVQRGLVEADGLVQAGVALVERELEAMWDEAILDGELSVDQRTRLHTANVTAARLAVRAIDLATDIAGTAAVNDGHVLARCRRDAHALAAHISISGTSVEHNAKTRLGVAAISRLV